MGSRWLQAKRLKIAKRRRKLPHTLTKKAAGINAVLLAEYHARAKSVRDPFMRAKFGPEEHTFTEQELERGRAIKPKHVMPKKGHQVPELRDPVHPRIRVLNTLMELKQGDNRGQSVSHFHEVKLVDGKLRKLSFWWSGNEFFFKEILTWTTRISIIYGSYDTAMRAFNHGTITWTSQDPPG